MTEKQTTVELALFSRIKHLIPLKNNWNLKSQTSGKETNIQEPFQADLAWDNYNLLNERKVVY